MVTSFLSNFLQIYNHEKKNLVMSDRVNHLILLCLKLTSMRKKKISLGLEIIKLLKTISREHWRRRLCKIPFPSDDF